MAQARVIKVVETSELVGKGCDGDPLRRIKEYYTLDGKLLCKEADLEMVNVPSPHYRALHFDHATFRETLDSLRTLLFPRPDEPMTERELEAFALVKQAFENEQYREAKK